MPRVAMAVDSGLDIPAAILKKYDIVQIPVHVNWQGRQYRDKIDLQVQDLFKQDSGRDFPTTSQPSPGEFAAVYAELAQHADVILSWHIASALSGTWASAKAGAAEVDCDVRVIDTKSVSMGGGLSAMAAAAVLAEGGSLEQAMAAGLAARDNMQIRLVLNTLEYVLRGGRISRLEATVGVLLKIKPMLAIEDGVLRNAGLARCRKRSLDLLLNTVTKACTSRDGKNFIVAVGHACAQSDAEYINAGIQEALPQAVLVPYEVGIGIGAHGGPGVVGACYYNKPVL